jgi:hypothetical protein
MSTALRTALLELGDVPPPPDLAGGALARARRDRRRDVAVAGIAAVLTAAAVAVPVAALGRPDPTPPAAALAPRFLVTGYASRDPDETTFGLGSYQVYRRSAGYLGTPWRAAVPSPDGRAMAVTARDGKVGIVSADRVGDPAAVRWIPGPSSEPGPVWSPDSRRLYVPAHYVRTDTQAGTVAVFGVVVDARTAARRETRLRWRQAGRLTGQIVFGPGGAGFAVAPARSSPSPEAGDILRLFDGLGKPLRTVRVGRVAVPGQPFSPDGRLLATYADGQTQVLDLATGAKVGRPAAGEAVGWYDGGRLVVRTGRSVRVVNFRSGRVLAERDLAAAGRELTGVWLAPLDGPPPPGAIVL